MPRRASSGVNVGQIVAIAAAIVGFLVAAVFLIYLVAGDLLGAKGGGSGGSGGRDFSSAATLEVSTYLENANSLRGNVYRVTGKVEETLKWTPDRGRLISLSVEGGGATSPVPVLVPEDFSSTNIERGVDFTFLVRVDRGGLLIAERIAD
ncbi:MAG: hypothetical protein KDM91_02775 [Verrucomicrobiae bacterium]|nr:hypothetical protein [Verrucomicrobiae bacterium]MCP5551005.1 hypothetical protein [Akkermansiaceae bacterium]